MNANPSVNRYLRDEAMDHIDHALGRPIFPMRESYRNYFATDTRSDLAMEFAHSPHWERCGSRGDMDFFGVTDAGRRALAAHLQTLEKPWRVYAVTFEGETSIVPAHSRAGAKYKLFLQVSDCWPDLTFGQLCRGASVRVAS